MKFNCFKGTFAGLVFIVSSIAQAGLINADYQTAGDGLAMYDDSTGLQWLDLSVTSGVAINNAENQFQGYRLATFNEWLGIFNQFFPDYVDDGAGQADSHGSGSNSGYNDGHTQMLQLLSSSNGSSSWSYGFIKEGGTTKLGGSYVSGTHYHTYRNAYNYNYTNDSGIGGWGVYMVKNVDVPEPSTLAIFALGIMGLASRRFKKQS